VATTNSNLNINTNVFQSPLSVIRDIFNYKNDPIRFESLDIDDPYSCQLQNIHGSYSGNSNLLKSINLRITNSSGLNSIIDLKPYLSGKNYIFPVNSDNPNSSNYYPEGNYKIYYSVTDIYDQTKEYSYDAQFQTKDKCTPKSSTIVNSINQGKLLSQLENIDNTYPNPNNYTSNTSGSGQSISVQLPRTGGKDSSIIIMVMLITILLTFVVSKKTIPKK
jgi:LPXTG-motif cell wall-anchored protein